MPCSQPTTLREVASKIPILFFFHSTIYFFNKQDCWQYSSLLLLFSTTLTSSHHPYWPLSHFQKQITYMKKKTCIKFVYALLIILSLTHKSTVYRGKKMKNDCIWILSLPFPSPATLFKTYLTSLKFSFFNCALVIQIKPTLEWYRDYISDHWKWLVFKNAKNNANFSTFSYHFYVQNMKHLSLERFHSALSLTPHTSTEFSQNVRHWARFGVHDE